MRTRGIEIIGIEDNSIAQELGIEVGQRVISINGEEFHDILEYKFLTVDEYIEIEITDNSGEATVYEIDKDYGEDLGLCFDGLIDNERSCTNNCIFCFIDQMPKGMRETLYFKDDDTRLSFLLGNFVTLTNLKEDDIKRIIKYRISPINVSIHTTNMKLRQSMLNNRFADKLMDYLKMLTDGGIEIKGQIVLCRDYNDGQELEKTLNDLSELYPGVSCVAIVPIGLTKHRDGLPTMRAFDKSSASDTIKQVSSLQKKYKQRFSNSFAYLSDEFYAIAEEPLLEYDEYEGFPQLENGVGLLKLLEYNIDDTLYLLNDKANYKRRGIIVTGEYASPYMFRAMEKIKSMSSGINIEVVTVVNKFFGELVKVAGLLTAGDIIEKLKGKDLGDTLYITESMLKADENIFLDDMTVEDMEKRLNVKIQICKEDGSDLIEKIIAPKHFKIKTLTASIALY